MSLIGNTRQVGVLWNKFVEILHGRVSDGSRSTLVLESYPAGQLSVIDESATTSSVPFNFIPFAIMLMAMYFCKRGCRLHRALYYPLMFSSIGDLLENSHPRCQFPPVSAGSWWRTPRLGSPSLDMCQYDIDICLLQHHFRRYKPRQHLWTTTSYGRRHQPR